MSQADPSPPHSNSTNRVPLANRYAGAWFEYNGRITARHNLTTMYLSGATVLIGFLYSIPDTAHGHDKGTSLHQLIVPTAFSLPAISLIYSLFMFMHDGIMGLLHNYMIVCEKFGNEENSLPSYHSDPLWNAPFFKYRMIQNAIMATLIVLFCVLALLRAESHMSHFVSNVFFVFMAAPVILSILAILDRRRWGRLSKM